MDPPETSQPRAGMAVATDLDLSFISWPQGEEAAGGREVARAMQVTTAALSVAVSRGYTCCCNELDTLPAPGRQRGGALDGRHRGHADTLHYPLDTRLRGHCVGRGAGDAGWLQHGPSAITHATHPRPWAKAHTSPLRASCSEGEANLRPGEGLSPHHCV